MTSLQFYLLGPLDLRSDGQPVPRPPTSKSQSLLAYLVLHRYQPQPRDRLVGLFWAERPERNARRSLSTALWHIRRCLPEESVLLSDARTVQFDRHADCWLDVEEFAAHVSRADVAGLQSALALYRGDFLEGFYDDWILGERYRLEALLVEALARLMAAHEAAGDHRTALVTAQRLLDRDPLREDAHRLAMRAYCHLGQRNAALEQYERCRQIVQAELGAEPMDETLALHQAILSGEFQVGPPVEIPLVPAPALARAGRSPLDVTPPVRLVGREPEMGLLHDTWQATQAGQGKLVLIGGEAGVGKTRLAEEFANHLRWQGAHVLFGRCYEFERTLPFQPLAEALHATLPALSDDELAAFPAWALGQVARLVPEVLERSALSAVEGVARNQVHDGDNDPPDRMPGSPGLDQEQVRLFEGVTHILAALSSPAPLLLVLEDLQWASESTLGLLHHLVRHLAECPVLIVGTFRPETTDGEHPLRAFRRRLTREGLACSLSLARLSAQAVQTMLVEMSGAGGAVAPLAQRLYLETEGNPFFLMEIVKALFETDMIRLEEGTWQGDLAQISAGTLPLPASLSETIQARVRRLEETAQDALRLAAVLGREFAFDLLDTAWGRGEAATLEALDALLRRRLIEETDAASDSDFAFTHHKIQEIVYQSLPGPRRLHLHARVGAAIEIVYAAELEARAGELAHHFERACLADSSLCGKAIAYLKLAGEQAVRQSANQEAIAYYRRGLDMLHTLSETEQRLQQEIELQLALASTTAMVYGYAAPETRRAYDHARDLCRRLGQTPALFTSLVGLCRYYGVGGNPKAGMELAEELLVIASSAGDDALLIEAHRQMGGHLFALGQLKEARAFLQRGLARYDVTQHEALAYRFGHDPGVTFLGYMSMTLWLLGYPEQAQVHSRELRSLMRSLTQPSSLACGYALLAMQACMAHEVEATLDHAEAAIRLGQRHGLPSWTILATALRGWARTEQGHAASGLAQLQDATPQWQGRGFVHFAPFLLALQAEAYLKLAMLDESAAILSGAHTIAHRGDRYWTAELHRLKGELARAEGRAAREAEAHFQQAISTARAHAARMLELRAATSLARLWRDQDRHQDARQRLSGIYHWFEEGLDSRELLVAAALLDTLA